MAGLAVPDRQPGGSSRPLQRLNLRQSSLPAAKVVPLRRAARRFFS